MSTQDWRPLIIAGLPRCGTTLLSTFLASQAQCTFITDYLSAFTETADRLGVEWTTTLTTTQKRIALAIVRDQLLRFRHPVLVSAQQFDTLSALHRAVLCELSRAGDRVVGHKLLLSPDRLAAALRQTDWRVVVLYRDPRDAAVSYFHRTGAGVEGYLEEWRRTVSLVENARSTRLFAIRYEDLVGEPHRALAPLFDALGLPLDVERASLMFDRGPSGRIRWEGNATFDAPRRPFDDRAVARWKEAEASRIVRYAATTCRREIVRCGYPAGPPIPPGEAARWQLHRAVYRAVRGVDRAWESGRAQILGLFTPQLDHDSAEL